MANTKIVKLKWAKKLASAKFFVVLTDKESVIALDGVDPDSFEDIMALYAQQAEIEEFLERLKQLKTQHDLKIEELRQEKDRANTTRRKKVTKIKVKEG